MKLSQLTALVSVARWGSFSEAALELDISQSGVSEAIGALEGELKVRLLERGRFGARLTPVGERVLARAQDALDALEGMVQEAALEKGEVRGVVRIVCFRSVAAHVVPALMAEARRRHPALEVQLEERSCFFGDTVSLLLENRADIAFLSERRDETMGWELMRDPFQALFPLESAPRSGPVSLSELAGVPLILSSDGDCGVRVPGHLEAHGHAVGPVQMVREDSTILGMVAQGLGVGVLPRLAVDFPSSVQMAPLEPPLERRIYVQVRQGALRLPSVRAFLHLLSERFPQSGLPRFGREEVRSS